MMQNDDPQLFLASTVDTTVGIRLDRVLSFTFKQADCSLAIRYLGDTNPERFEGPIAEAILRELRYAGRK